MFAIVGENGSGKSTLLKCLADPPARSRFVVTVNGKLAALLELIRVPMELSGRENVYLDGAILGLSKRDIDARFDEIVDFAGTARSHSRRRFRRAPSR